MVQWWGKNWTTATMLILEKFWSYIIIGGRGASFFAVSLVPMIPKWHWISLVYWKFALFFFFFSKRTKLMGKKITWFNFFSLISKDIVSHQSKEFFSVVREGAGSESGNQLLHPLPYALFFKPCSIQHLAWKYPYIFFLPPPPQPFPFTQP